MRRVLPLKLLMAVLLAACVTVNVYFPAAAAQSAADQIIDTVTGSGGAQPQSSNQNKPQGSTLLPQAAPIAPRDERPANPYLATAEVAGPRFVQSPLVVALGTVLNALVPAAHAQANANIDVNTPEIRAIAGSMAERYQQLKPYFASGAVGFTADGHVDVRDANAVPLPERANVKRLVAEDNRDRDALYAEVAKANGHPEWRAEIQSTFARRWIAKAEAGTWYQDGGAWKQK